MYMYYILYSILMFCIVPLFWQPACIDISHNHISYGNRIRISCALTLLVASFARHHLHYAIISYLREAPCHCDTECATAYNDCCDGKDFAGCVACRRVSRREILTQYNTHACVYVFSLRL